MSGLLYYSLHSRVLASDGELTYLPPAEKTKPDIVLRLESREAVPNELTPWHRAESVIEKDAGGDLIMSFTDGTVFRIGAGGTTITLLRAPSHYTRGDLAAYALGPVLAVALHLQGAVLLHAAAVVIRARAVLFTGPAGCGKSTLAAILQRQGYAVLSDDITEIAESNALPSLPAIRLWPDVLEVLYGSALPFADRAPSWDKKIVGIDDEEGDRVPRPIAAICFLDAEHGNEGPRLERLRPRDGWKRLIADAYTARLPDPRMSQKIFEVTSSLADRIPMYAFTPPDLAVSQDLGSFLEDALP